jgi:hypothetical protein
MRRQSPAPRGWQLMPSYFLLDLTSIVINSVVFKR